ncbi:MAG: hypothetical protein HY094_00535 [Candidatus Melainabacteria bacterium]|nr:hypothetical protein [Candidatus Melainabacteria bacterium]
MVVRKKFKNLRLTNFVKAIGLTNVNEVFISNGIVIPKPEVSQEADIPSLDCKDCIIAPGFIDPQVNGLEKCNFWDLHENSFTEIDNLRLKLASCGVVAFCPTIITAPTEKVIKSIEYINSYIKQTNLSIGARILGIHIEGIFITKYGVHESKYVQKELTVTNIKPFIKENVILFTLAPELDRSGEAIKLLQKNNILVSIGHSNATYKESCNAINSFGLKTVTHMFNSLRGVEGFLHRSSNGESNSDVLRSKLQDDKKINPDNDGIMLALIKDKNVLCMVIADGIHVSKDVVKFLRQNKDSSHFALASDIVSSDFYNLAKSKGMLGGGETTLDRCISNLINWNVSEIEDCLLSASKPIARQLKAACELGLGEILTHKEANLVLWDIKKNAVKGTIIGENAFLNY